MSSSTMFYRPTIQSTPVPGIPRAPIIFNGIEKIVSPEAKRYFESKKEKLAYRLPWLSRDEIVNKEHKYHVVRLHELMVEGYFQVAQEVRSIIRFDKNVQRGSSWNGSFLIDDNKKIDLVTKSFKECWQASRNGRPEFACICKKGLADHFLREGEPFLANYLYHSCLKDTRKMRAWKEQTQAELHCLLAYLERPRHERILTLSNKEKILEKSIIHLTMCRKLSKGYEWLIGNDLIRIEMDTPLRVFGLGNETVEIEGSSMPMYLIAGILELDLLIGLADATLKLHLNSSKEDYHAAKAYADEALSLAIDINHPISLRSAILRCAIMEKNCHKYDDALAMLDQLMEMCDRWNDMTCKAIVLQNIGKCFINKHMIIEGLESLVEEHELAMEEEMKELQADSTKEIGVTLLEEGQLWESEEMLIESLELFRQTELSEKEEDALVFATISAGQHLYSRLTGLVRSEDMDSYYAINEWKSTRDPLPVVDSPRHAHSKIDSIYDLNKREMSHKYSNIDWDELAKDNYGRNFSIFQRISMQDINREVDVKEGFELSRKEEEIQFERQQDQLDEETKLNSQSENATQRVKARKSTSEERKGKARSKSSIASTSKSA